ncbi:hypothetical protein [Bradyrhizobium elkanii]|uniref:hypothetical protein n=1 Tax=Bradyrhizobium elkanii TaxID=29448 RepID=UPI001448F325|nr:hypothetical protein [Bradyrhizobium elkanii]MCS3577759.1 hypothetical protein [Bradyrhizobium elkanii]MCS3720634.1 hypothetical protein [Bradyrhizobium elkanii]MCS4005051.1 hypothetical protein [Bradyrhizobium elkanii USDA 61]MCW2130323.1 hypothetical protein [Bradyrhizobium elkanii]MCW2167999.1 hypothetical protein [Bradyrhizobium elkanii]
MAKRGWRRQFDDPIELPDGRVLVTLHDAASYIQKLSKAEHDLPHWQTAVEHLIYGAERAPAWMFFARVAFMQALHHGEPVLPAEPRKRPVKAYKIRR